MKFAKLFILLPLLTGCSAYRSDGRKFLEGSGLQTLGVAAQANLLSCPDMASWVILDPGDRATVYALESDRFELRISPSNEPSYSNCYQFNSAQEMYEKTSSAIDLTLLNQSLGEFAFHPLSHLK